MNHLKTKQFACRTMMLTLLMLYQSLWSCDIVIEKVHSETLTAERDVFIKFIAHYCNLCVSQSSDMQSLNQLFDQEEQLYQAGLVETLFFHALLDEQVIGYVSCDLNENYSVSIRQLAIDPDYFDVTLIKELLFAIFTAAPKTKFVTVKCPVTCPEIQALLVDLGFVRTMQQLSAVDVVYNFYVLKVHAKCKICDVLYGPDFWETESSDQDYSQYDSDVADGYLEDGSNAHAYE